MKGYFNYFLPFRFMKGGKNMNNGRQKEDQIMYSLTKNKFSELSEPMKELVTTLFGVIDPDKPVKAEYTIDSIKPDFVIKHNDKEKYVSMKSGASVQVHTEPINFFIEFLREQEVSEETIKTILLHHYGDGTIDGTGKTRYSLNELRYRLSDRIDAANIELNKDSDLLAKFAERVLFKGFRDDVPMADAIFHGDYLGGTVATRKQIMKFMRSRKWDYFDNLHIGPFFIKPHARYIGTEIKSEFSRLRVDVWWPRMLYDLDYIARKFGSYTPMRYRTYDE